ncbi:hypothetical protein GPECTOR_15g319 [Gonium pectorale]|uniref:F-box domain-containing protein n=1 Tax=Gonium pectorale TaxID=33097 RepID=A0A150GLL7_GONPE|nr:hypothetical protein GPECTOR_15g319 [Gonium pectorale]|eukprot:KXZ50635.1 hypothetical protein GPECTOR_15g319 [Gonium pectorale]
MVEVARRAGEPLLPQLEPPYGPPVHMLHPLPAPYGMDELRRALDAGGDGKASDDGSECDAAVAAAAVATRLSLTAAAAGARRAAAPPTPAGTLAALRLVCRRWRRAADESVEALCPGQWPHRLIGLERFPRLRRLDLGCLGPDPAPLSRAPALLQHLAPPSPPPPPATAGPVPPPPVPVAFPRAGAAAARSCLQHLTLSKECLVASG